MICHVAEFCPTYYKHGDTKCAEMLRQGRCGIRKARIERVPPADRPDPER